MSERPGYPASMAAGLRRRREGLERYGQWVEEHPLYPEPAAALSGVGLLYDLLPPDARQRPLETAGVAELHRSLAVLGGPAR